MVKKFYSVHEKKVQGGKKLQNSLRVLLIDTTEYISNLTRSKKTSRDPQRNLEDPWGPRSTIEIMDAGSGEGFLGGPNI